MFSHGHNRSVAESRTTFQREGSHRGATTRHRRQPSPCHCTVPRANQRPYRRPVASVHRPVVVTILVAQRRHWGSTANTSTRFRKLPVWFGSPSPSSWFRPVQGFQVFARFQFLPAPISPQVRVHFGFRFIPVQVPSPMFFHPCTGSCPHLKCI